MNREKTHYPHMKIEWLLFVKPSLVKIGPVVIFEKICDFAFSLLSPIIKGRGHSFDQE